MRTGNGEARTSPGSSISVETTDEVDALWGAVKDRAEVIYAVDDFDYGAHEFGIRDDNGYSLAFGAPSKPTAGRPG
jgi:hypothetical protein